MEQSSNQTLSVNLGPNQVLVSPGDRIFTSIQEAINSITDASQQKRYMVYIGPGTYNEYVEMKEWVYMQGAGQDENFNNRTIITAAGSPDDRKATVKAASNSAITGITIESRYAYAGGYTCTCLDCTGVTGFRCYGVRATSYDGEDACNMVGVANNIGRPNGPACKVILSHSVFVAQGQHPQSWAMGLWAASGGNYDVISSKFVGLGGKNGVGAAGNPGKSTLTFTDCAITGRDFSLETTDESVVKAINCTLVGPVDKGVIVV